ncbi:MAG TPA: hypothetical protein VMF89_15160 [Polyangiales bacterium]|nr:hypothetical protein [Polyangiales bacterium]
MNLRNRLIWIGLLSVGFAGVQLIAGERKAEQERVEYLKTKAMPVVNECARLAQQRVPGLHGMLALQVGIVPEGKLAALVERVELSAASEVQDPGLVDCIRERAKNLTVPLPLRRGAEQVELAVPIEPVPAGEAPR